jgi:hypothetical protein
VSYRDSAGIEHRIPREVIVPEALNRALSTIEKRARSPEEALPEQLALLARNGVTYPAFERVFAAAGLVLSVDLATTEDVPVVAANAFELYKRMGAINPRLRDAHVGKAGRDTRLFFEFADLAERYVTPGEPRDAMFVAAKAVQAEQTAASLGDFWSRQLLDKKIRGMLNSPLWPGGKVKNQVEMLAKLRDLAGLYLRALPTTPADAIDEAAKRLEATHTKINGWAIDTHDTLLPDAATFDALAQELIERYVKKHGNEEGVDEGDLALIPGETDGSWIIFNMGANAPVDHVDEDGLFATADLQRLVAQGRMKHLREIVARAPDMRTSELMSVAPGSGVARRFFGTDELKLSPGVPGQYDDFPLPPRRPVDKWESPEAMDEEWQQREGGEGGEGG